MESIIIFGGCGNIGMQFAEHLLGLSSAPKKIFLADIQNRPIPRYHPKLQEGLTKQTVVIQTIDVRQSIPSNAYEGHDVSLIANFAAIHREPGHLLAEYYETNIKGAETVTQLARTLDCKKILFTSSVAPYGPTENPKDEASLTTPESPYGGSKLAAEKIHQIWQASAPDHKLVTVRPGVVFGPGEQANVHRMITAIRKGYFFYCDNQAVVKAGGYIKELCTTMTWTLDRMDKTDENYILYNFTTNPVPTLQDYAIGIMRTLGIEKKTYNIPYSLLRFASILLESFCRPLKISHPFSPVRVRKLVRSNNIVPKYLEQNGYKWQYSLNEALDDWQQDCPTDWWPNKSSP